MAPARRVLFVLDRLSRKGGAEHYILAVAMALRECGIEVHALHGYTDATAAGHPFTSVQRFPPLGRRHPDPRDRRDAPRLAELLGATRPDAVVAQNLMTPAFLEVIAPRPKAIHVIQDHRLFCPARGKVFPDGTPCAEPMGPACDLCFAGPEGLDGAHRDRMMGLVRARREAALRFPVTVVLSRYMQRELTQAGWTDGAIHVIPPAAPDREALDPMLRQRRLAVVGRITWAKGSVHVLRALADGHVTVPVTFVGEGAAAPDVEQLATRLGMDVRITGWLDAEGVRREMARTQVVAVPALWAEPFGIAGLEAAAAGLPVVAHAVGGIPEWAHHGETALLAPPNDGPALAALVQSLLDDPAGTAAFGASARERVRRAWPSEAFETAWSGMLAR